MIFSRALTTTVDAWISSGSLTPVYRIWRECKNGRRRLILVESQLNSPYFSLELPIHRILESIYGEIQYTYVASRRQFLPPTRYSTKVKVILCKGLHFHDYTSQVVIIRSGGLY